MTKYFVLQMKKKMCDIMDFLDSYTFISHL